VQATSSPTSEDSHSLAQESEDSGSAPETVEIPLTSDSEFFQILKRELRDLNQLQDTEQKQLSTQIVQFGSDLTALTESSSKKSKAEIEAWREIFRRYVESQIFFSTVEQGPGLRTSLAAQKKLEEFSNALQTDQKKLKLNAHGKAAVTSFLQINASLLQFMKFQEINRTALTKIMKKFDKRTALHAQANVPMMLSNEPFIARDLAKAACFTIQEKLLPIVPQLNDYLCPVCFSISFKPIRLRCTHVFCIRCLIVMQRAKQDHCPLCRGNVVMEASSGTYISFQSTAILFSSLCLLCMLDNLDMQLMTFLQAKFPNEVKAKQKENQRAAGVDRYGEDFDKCAAM
jgi:E3 ubiquitin-protein ligase BAH